MSQPLDIDMPQDLDVGPTYTVRVTAINPSTGALVSGVNVGTVVITAALVQGTTDGLETGQWFLLPGPNA